MLIRYKDKAYDSVLPVINVLLGEDSCTEAQAHTLTKFCRDCDAARLEWSMKVEEKPIYKGKCILLSRPSLHDVKLVSIGFMPAGHVVVNVTAQSLDMDMIVLTERCASLTH